MFYAITGLCYSLCTNNWHQTPKTNDFNGLRPELRNSFLLGPWPCYTLKWMKWKIMTSSNYLLKESVKTISLSLHAQNKIVFFSSITLSYNYWTQCITLFFLWRTFSARAYASLPTGSGFTKFYSSFQEVTQFIIRSWHTTLDLTGLKVVQHLEPHLLLRLA